MLASEQDIQGMKHGQLSKIGGIAWYSFDQAGILQESVFIIVALNISSDQCLYLYDVNIQPAQESLAWNTMENKVLS